jgi:GT2 family glycosyltransferase
VSVDVRVGIVSWETAAQLERCLEALPAALGGLTAEVVVVDNASRDGSAEIARSHGATVIANPRNVGFARAMNVALAGTSASFLLALNPDSEPRPCSLERLIRHLRDEPGTGLVAPRLLNVDGSLQHSVHRFPSVTLALVMGLVPFALRRGPVGRRFWLDGFADHRRGRSIDWAIGAVHAIRRAALADPEHAYPERTFMYGEDMSLCWELRQAGWDVCFEPASEVVHVGGVAARRAFGDTIDARKLAADYDWFQSVRGPYQARLWAAANMLGYGAKLCVARLIWPADDPRTRRTSRLLRLHARRLGW